MTKDLIEAARRITDYESSGVTDFNGWMLHFEMLRAALAAYDSAQKQSVQDSCCSKCEHRYSNSVLRCFVCRQRKGETNDDLVNRRESGNRS